MHLKSLILGIVIGVALGISAMFLFGDEILGNVGDATQEVGKTVRDAGKTIEKTGDKLK